MDKFDALVTLQNREIADARGEEFFFDLPDSWYEPMPTYGCENGHASRRYLKSEEHGKLCLACGKRIVMLPCVYDTDAKLSAALDGILNESAQRAAQAAQGGEHAN